MDNDYLLEVDNISLAFPRFNLEQNSLKDYFIRSLSRKLTLDHYDLILSDISFNVSRGDRIGLIAENGAGKSSLCRCISGSYPVSKGIIKKNGEIRAIFEASLAIFLELSGRENMKILAEIFYDRSKYDLNEIVEESIDFSELGASIDKPVKTYSKGMLLRLTMSLLSAKPTDILILDEVFDGADEFFRAKLAIRIRNLINNSGAVIFVSHLEDQINEICNRVIVLRNKKIIFDGNLEKAFLMYRKSIN
jgi:ABC-type polysaccharide/polyol phosphate transport system ATPase subunit